MRHRASAIVIRDGKVLAIHRNSLGREYYVLPGGGVEEGETPEITAVREILEESGMEAVALKVLSEVALPDSGQYMYFVSCEISQTAELIWQEEYKQAPTNVYCFEWLSISKLGEYPLVPKEAIPAIVGLL